MVIKNILTACRMDSAGERKGVYIEALIWDDGAPKSSVTDNSQ
ncbi:MAG: hypothetical protein O3B01_14625 [Planctomycetota bacterium]|nr:hypothetical protein [Planctomycetota bacterium]MDA1139807.1 hypothetical protein [Planctomycetota bacterium]